MKNVKQIITKLDLFDADLSNIALSKKKRKEFIIDKIQKKYVVYDEMNNQEVIYAENNNEARKKALKLFNIKIIKLNE